MDPKQFISVATNPAKWFQRSQMLRRNGQLLRSISDQAFALAFKVLPDLSKDPGVIPPKQAKSIGPIMDEAGDYFNGACLFYGLALESAFKGRIIAEHPEWVRLRLVIDGRGQTIEGELLRLNDKDTLLDNHDLNKLATVANVIGDKKTRIFSDEKDNRWFVHMLSVLTEVVTWSGRYPVPKRRIFEKSDPSNDWKKLDVVDRALESLLPK